VGSIGAAVPPPRALHVITSLEEGGAQAMLHKLLAQPGAASRAAVAVLVEPGPAARRFEALGVRVFSLGMERGRASATALPRLVRLIRRERPDVVQTWLYHADLLGGLAAALARVPVIWGVRNERLQRHESATTRLTRRLCGPLSWRLPRSVVCNSEAARRSHEQLGYAPHKLVVVPNGFDLERFRPSPDARAALRNELGVAPSTPLVGMVARLDPHKDHATFLAAARRVADAIGDARFVLCGEGTSPGDAALDRLAAASGVGARVHLLGKRRDVERVTAALDVACLTSTSESFPNVIGEAMACGVPCVATDCGDVREIMGGYGRVVPIGDAAAVAAAVLDLLRLDPAARDALVEAARQRVRARYDIAVVARRLEEIQRAACS
jgi:glycosyltransferase involved in cell wall biosynthesis